MINEVSKQWCDTLYKNKIYNIEEYNECIKPDDNKTPTPTSATEPASIEEKLIFDLINKIDAKNKYILEREYITKLIEKLEKSYLTKTDYILSAMDKTNQEFKQRVSLILTNKVNCVNYINDYENCQKSAQCKERGNMTFLQQYGKNKACIKFDDMDEMNPPELESDNKTLIDRNYYSKLNNETLKLCDTKSICSQLIENDEFNYIVQYIDDITPEDIKKIKDHTPFNADDIKELRAHIAKIQGIHLDKLKKRIIELNILIDKTTTEYRDTDTSIFSAFRKLSTEIDTLNASITENTSKIQNISKNIAEINTKIADTKANLEDHTMNIDILTLNKEIATNNYKKNDIEKYIYMIILGSSSLLMLFLIYRNL